MISETAFMNCENLPEIMRNKFDRPWTFVGKIRGTPRTIASVCRCSVVRPAVENGYRIIVPDAFKVVECDGYVFYAEPYLPPFGPGVYVIVYFGVCEKCGLVHWGHSDVPLSGLKAFVQKGW